MFANIVFDRKTMFQNIVIISHPQSNVNCDTMKDCRTIKGNNIDNC